MQNKLKIGFEGRKGHSEALCCLNIPRCIYAELILVFTLLFYLALIFCCSFYASKSSIFIFYFLATESSWRHRAAANPPWTCGGEVIKLCRRDETSTPSETWYIINNMLSVQPARLRLGWAATELVAGVNILDSAVILCPEKFQIQRQKMLLHLSVVCCKTSENGGVVLGHGHCGADWMPLLSPKKSLCIFLLTHTHT